MNCKHEYIKEYLDINGVRLMFKILKDKMDLSKEELLGEMKKNNRRLEKKIFEISDNLNENYYTKIEIDGMMPDRMSERQIQRAYDRANN